MNKISKVVKWTLKDGEYVKLLWQKRQTLWDDRYKRYGYAMQDYHRIEEIDDEIYLLIGEESINKEFKNKGINYQFKFGKRCSNTQELS